MVIHYFFLPFLDTLAFLGFGSMPCSFLNCLRLYSDSTNAISTDSSSAVFTSLNDCREVCLSPSSPTILTTYATET